MRAALLVALLVSVAAHAAAQDAGVPAPTVPPAPPTSRRLLPPIDPELTRELAPALAAFDTAVRLRAPRMTDAVDPRKLQRRVDETFRPWLARRMAAMRAAEAALSGVAARSNVHAVLAEGLLAVLWEDFAWQIGHIAAPRGLRTDPQLVATWHELIDEQAEPLRQRAAVAYASCAAQVLLVTAMLPHPSPELDAWAAFCRQRGGVVSPPGPDAGTP